MTYQWGTPSTQFDSMNVNLRLNVTHTATGVSFWFINGGDSAANINDPNALAAMGAIKTALEANGFSSVQILNQGTSSQPIQAV